MSLRRSLAQRTNTASSSRRSKTSPRVRPNGSRSIRIEPLEQRAMLSIVFPNSEDGQADAESVIDDLPQLVGPELVGKVVSKVPAGAEGAWLYEAFPGEINEVSIYGGMLDTYLLLNDSDDVALYRVRPAVAKEVMGTDASSGWGVAVEGAVEVFFEPSFELRGPDPSLWTVGFSVGLHAGVTGSIGTSRDWAKTFSPLDQWLDMADARAVLPNSAAFGSFDALAEAVDVCSLRASIEDPALDPLRPAVAPRISVAKFLKLPIDCCPPGTSTCAALLPFCLGS